MKVGEWSQQLFLVNFQRFSFTVRVSTMSQRKQNWRQNPYDLGLCIWQLWPSLLSSTDEQPVLWLHCVEHKQQCAQSPLCKQGLCQPHIWSSRQSTGLTDLSSFVYGAINHSGYVLGNILTLNWISFGFSNFQWHKLCGVIKMNKGTILCLNYLVQNGPSITCTWVSTDKTKVAGVNV